MSIYDNANKLRCRNFAWMRHPEWLWHVVHTDWMRDKMPISPPQSDLVKKLASKNRATPFGHDLTNINPNGPNRSNT
jgi:hypothetical protein